jgi:hypothetical protein
MNDASIAQELCENWQKSQRPRTGYTLDELAAFMSGVMAGLAYQRAAQTTERHSTSQAGGTR